jgi:hypothetical protein
MVCPACGKMGLFGMRAFCIAQKIHRLKGWVDASFTIDKAGDPFDLLAICAANFTRYSESSTGRAALEN